MPLQIKPYSTRLYVNSKVVVDSKRYLIQVGIWLFVEIVEHPLLG